MWEYYCNGCKQLRLTTGREKPQRCAACACKSLEVEAPGSDRLTKLRFGDRKPDAPLTVIVSASMMEPEEGN